MNSVILISLALLAGMISISQYFAFRGECTNKSILWGFGILSVSLAGSAVLSGAMVLTFGSDICFLLYGFDRFFKALIMMEIILLTQDMVDVKKRFISIFVTLVSYGAVILFLVDTFLQGGQLERSVCGVYFSPKTPWHLALYFVYYMMYVIMLATFVVYRSSAVIKDCERHDLLLLGIVYGFSSAGFIAEIFIIANKVLYIPFILIFNLIAVIFMRKLLIYHDSILIDESKFADVLDPSRTDVAFVLDDKLAIMYQNRKAEVFATMMKDEFLGRKLSNVFRFTDMAYGQIHADPTEVPFGINAVYEPNGHHVNMVIQHKLDSFGQILATSVYVYNLEENAFASEYKNDDITEHDDEHLIESCLQISKGARALVIDEDSVFLSVFARLLSQFGVKVEKATGGFDGVSRAGVGSYDIIFVSYSMQILSGCDTIKKIRALEGDYYKQVPVVFITDNDINDIFASLIDAGFNDYLTKPVSKKALSQVLTRWLWDRAAKITCS